MLCSPSVLWILTCIYRGLVVWLSKQHQNGHVYGDPTLYRIGLAISVPVLPISDAVHCNRSCSALQPPLQCTASVLAVHCILHANIYNLSRKRLQPFPQTFATAPANVCNRPCKRLRGKPLFRMMSFLWQGESVR